MRKTVVCCFVLVCLAGLQARGIHWLESEAHRGCGPKPGPAFYGTPSPLVPRDEPAVTRSVYGYSTYWTSDEYLRFDLLTHIGIFDVVLNPDGSISNYNGFPQNWAWTIDRAHRNGVKCEMVATCFDWANIHGAIRAPNSIPNLVGLASSAGMDGINLDFEGLWYGDRDTFTLFVRRMSAACRAAGLELTLATPPLNQENAFDLAALADTTDGLFLMGYDFHWRGGPEAGPVAPLFGWTFYGNLQMAINHYLGQVGHMRDVWFGVPYYGYQWPTYADTVRSRTTGPGEAVVYRDAPGFAQAHGYRWNDEGRSPWYAFNSGGWRQCWYDDDTSLALKYREVHEHDMLGTGMWALGYDGSRRELWAALREGFNRPLAGFTNGDCEQWRLDTLAVPSDTTENPVGWHEGRKARFRREDGLVHGGSHSIRHEPDSLGFDWPVISVLFQDVEVMPGTSYRFSAWGRKNDGLGNRMKLVLEWRDARYGVIASESSAVLEHDSTGWVQLATGQQAAPPGADFARLCLWMEGYGGADHWDDVDFSAVTGVEEKAEGGHPRLKDEGGRMNQTVMRAPELARFGGRVLDIQGRDVSDRRERLAPGVYFISEQPAFSSRNSGTAAVRKVVIQY